MPQESRYFPLGDWESESRKLYVANQRAKKWIRDRVQPFIYQFCCKSIELNYSALSTATPKNYD